jgi:hypothetical protein
MVWYMNSYDMKETYTRSANSCSDTLFKLAQITLSQKNRHVREKFEEEDEADIVDLPRNIPIPRMSTVAYCPLDIKLIGGQLQPILGKMELQRVRVAQRAQLLVGDCDCGLHQEEIES